jgi:Protein of unknown function (DUF3891)
MILRSKPTPVGGSGFVPVWHAVLSAQKANSPSYHLVRQPDHALLSGQIAERFAIAGAPAVDDDIVRGISLHDEGWRDFDDGRQRLQATSANYSADSVALNLEGKPLSFLEIKAEDFLRAWNGSIAAAEAVAPIAGLIVSGHFRRIGQFGMSTGTYSGGDTQRVQEFIAREEERNRRLLPLQSRSEKEVEDWTDVLQFCDLLSLYLCCGSRESVEFPQPVGPKGETIRLQGQDGIYVLSPSPFAREVEFSLEAQSYPVDGREPSVHLSWRVR